MRLIDADKLKNSIDEILVIAGKISADSASYNLIQKLKNIIDEQPTADDWISVSERLPKSPYGCIVTATVENPFNDDKYNMVLPWTCGYHEGQWNDSDGDKVYQDIVAWKPLPKPYELIKSED